MPTLIPGFEYDIFISYRHNDNRSGWVTDFVNALQEEIAATIKEPLSIYFDKNPHDGLLQNHNVDKSLEGKLKCLIFIPIISQTYCDPKSFAWQYEFCAFNKLAKEDQFGRDIKLSNGNVASRILPIKFHDLDVEDKALLENELIGMLRAIEFIFKAPGVNRPLNSKDDEIRTAGKVLYRDQVNKMANAIKGIILGIRNFSTSVQPTVLMRPVVEVVEKSIVVLPFANMSNDPEQEYFSDGLTEEIITDLSRLSNLLVISRSSAMTFKSSNKKISDIAQEVNVRYILEGSVRKSGNNLRITAQLIDALTDTHLWAEKYNGTLEDIFDIQEKVSRSIVEGLRIKLTNEENRGISQRPINNIVAYDCYLRARSELVKWTKNSGDDAKKHIQNGLDITGPNATLYAGMAYAYYNYANLGFQSEDGWNQAETYVRKAFELDPECNEGHLVLGLLNQTIKGNQIKSIQHFKRALVNMPNNLDALFWLSWGYLFVGETNLARPLVNKMLSLDPLSANIQITLGAVHIFEGQFDQSDYYYSKALQMESQNPFINLMVSFGLAYRGRTDECKIFIKDHVQQNLDDFLYKLIYALGHALEGETELTKSIMQKEDIENWAWQDVYFSYLFTELFALTNQTSKALDWLERSVSRGFTNSPFMSFDPLLKNIRKETRFQKLMDGAKLEYENFVG